VCSSTSIVVHIWTDELVPTTILTLWRRVFFGVHSHPGRSRHNPTKTKKIRAKPIWFSFFKYCLPINYNEILLTGKSMQRIGVTISTYSAHRKGNTESIWTLKRTPKIYVDSTHGSQYHAFTNALLFLRSYNLFIHISFPSAPVSHIFKSLAHL